MPFAAKRDSNNVPAIFGVSSVDLKTPTPILVNPVTGALLMDSSSIATGIYTPATYVIAPSGYGHKADYYTDGVADDIEINAALTLISNAGGGTLLLKAGTYFITSKLLIPSNTLFMGEGESTILKKTTGNPTSNIIQNADSTNGNTFIQIKDLKIDGNYESGNLDFTFHLYKVTNSLVQRVHLINGWEGFGTENCSDVVFRDCIGDGNYDWNFYNFSATRVKVMYCQSLNAKHGVNEGFGIAVYANSSYCEIIGNYVYNSTHNGIQINAGSGTQDNVGTVVQDNIVVDAGHYGIMITDDANTFHIKKVSIINNRVYGAVLTGLNMIDAYDAYVAGNKLISNNAGLTYQTCNNLTSVGNIVENNSVGLRIVGDGSTVTSINDYVNNNTTNFVGANAQSGLRTIGPTDLTLDGQSNRTITIAQQETASTAGQNLTVTAGTAVNNGTNLNGGTTTIGSGLATGSGTGKVQIQTSATTASDLTAIGAINMNNIGSGYSISDVLTITGGSGSGATATVSSVAVSGQLSGVTLNSAGTGYVVGDVLTVPTGTGGTITVTVVDTNGKILAATLTTQGSGYTATSNVSVTGGTGTGATFDTTIFATGAITGISLTSAGTGYVLTTGAATTGGGGTGATINIFPFANRQNSLATRVTVLGNGNVGIGTTAPRTVLDIRSLKGATVDPQDMNLYIVDTTPLAINDGGGIGFVGVYKGDGSLAGYGSIIALKEDAVDGNYGAHMAFNTRVNGQIVAETMRLTSDGKLGIGTTTPTARLHLKAGTASANTAPLKFTGGTNLTTVEDGAGEYDGAQFYLSSTLTQGPIATIAAAPTAGGTGYTVGDVLTITPGGSGGTVTVATVSSGVVTGLTLTTAGTGYSTGTGKATTGGTGTGCTVNIQTLSPVRRSIVLSSSTGNIDLDGTAVRDLTVGRANTSNGNNLTIQAGGGQLGGTDLNGGTLFLASGIATGNNSSSMQLQVVPNGQGSGTTDRSPLSVMYLSATGTNNTRARLGLGTNGVGSADGISMSGNSAYQVAQNRHTTSNTAGNNLTVQSGGATSGATNKSAGTLVLSSGISTGSGTGQVQIKTSPGTAGSTSDNTLVTAMNFNGNGIVSTYGNIATSGLGIPAIYGYGRSTGQTAAVASIATYTVGASDGSFLVSGNVNVTTSTTHSFSLQVTYTDETNTSRTVTFNVQQLGGTLVTSITNVTGAGPYEGVPLHIRAKASTVITILTSGTFTSVTYNAEGNITQIA